MTIQENIQAVIQQVEDDQSGVLGEKLRMLALDAIYAGQGGNEWESLMTYFAGKPTTNAVQLARLTGVGDVPCPDSPYAKQARAYLIRNVVCGTPTFTTTHFGVDDLLDKTLPPNA